MTRGLHSEAPAGAVGLPEMRGPLSLAVQVPELKERASGGDRRRLGEWATDSRVLTVRVRSPFLACWKEREGATHSAATQGEAGTCL